MQLRALKEEDKVTDNISMRRTGSMFPKSKNLEGVLIFPALLYLKLTYNHNNKQLIHVDVKSYQIIVNTCTNFTITCNIAVEMYSKIQRVLPNTVINCVQINTKTEVTQKYVITAS